VFAAIVRSLFAVIVTMAIVIVLVNVLHNLVRKSNEKPANAINPAQEAVIYMPCVSDIIASGKKKK